MFDKNKHNISATGYRNGFTAYMAVKGLLTKWVKDEALTEREESLILARVKKRLSANPPEHHGEGTQPTNTEYDQLAKVLLEDGSSVRPDLAKKMQAAYEKPWEYYQASELPGWTTVIQQREYRRQYYQEILEAETLRAGCRVIDEYMTTHASNHDFSLVHAALRMHFAEIPGERPWESRKAKKEQLLAAHSMAMEHLRQLLPVDEIETIQALIRSSEPARNQQARQ